MKTARWLCLLLLFLTALPGRAQTPAAGWQPLREYEGEYEYQRGTTLRLAASPREARLYALIGDGRYPLQPLARPDAFVDSGHDTVRFERDAAGRVAGYTVGGRRYRRLRAASFPMAMWYPRPLAPGQPFAYRYARPPKQADGLPVGSLRGTGLDAARLDTLVRRIVDGSYPDVHSVLILHRGRLVFEEYFYEYDRETLHPLRSATKSLISALTGQAIAQGLLPGVGAPVAPYFPEYQLAHNSPPKQAITVADLLSNQSGLDCDITENSSPGNETVMGASRDWVRFTLDLPMREAPGRVGRYCSGNPITLGRLVEKQARQPLADYARQHLFGPLGISRFDWRFQPDSSSAETFCQASLRPRDMAKFGQLYLDHGRWRGRPVLPAAWVDSSLARHSVVQGVNYGYLWWLKYLDADGTRYHGAAAQGNGGQRITVWPAQQLVVVVTGGNYNRQSPSDALIARYVLAAFSKAK
jgi:CubicO group peptidase (beta-lactamase class C family)